MRNFAETQDAVIDLDITTENGEALPVRFMHRVTASRDGRPGPMRSIVLNRAQGDHAGLDARAAEIRFTRFFNSTPMAIAGIDGEGRILRTNAPFLSLFTGIVDRDTVDAHATLDAVIAPDQRDDFARALDAAKQGKAEIAPIDTTLPDDPERHMRFYVNAVVDTGSEEAEEAASAASVAVCPRAAAATAKAGKGKKKFLNQGTKGGDDGLSDFKYANHSVDDDNSGLPQGRYVFFGKSPIVYRAGSPKKHERTIVA